MPEIIEVEMYRRGAEPLVGQRIRSVDAPDDWYLKNADAASVQEALVGAEICGLDRIGKLMLVETSSVTVGLRFGMTGRLVVSGVAVIAALEYSSVRLAPDWDRFGLEFETGATLVMNDPRRLGGVSVDPDISRLGSDAWTLTSDQLADALAGSSTALKARLLDQSRVAGLGNLLVDEILWAAGLAPNRPARSLGSEAVVSLAETITATIAELAVAGGSNAGPLFPHRDHGQCPGCGQPLVHGTIGGRSTWWCPVDQV